LRVERGESVLVGVNRYGDGREPPVFPAPDYSALERDQVERLAAVRAKRDHADVEQALGALSRAAEAYVHDSRQPTSDNRPHLMPLIVDAVRARASVGEIADTLRERWGTYTSGG
jgi:methylmalonyl-CoA mutase, N-terminal domain